MSFKEKLETICQQAPGSLSVLVMSMDGIPVMKHEVRDPGLDMEVFLIELVGPVKLLMAAGESAEAGQLQGLELQVDKGTLLLQELVDEHFVALLMEPGAVVGRGRFALRLAVRGLKQELV